MKNIFKNNKGFTLMEAMITIGLMGIVSVGVFKLLNNGTDMWNRGVARMKLQQEARLAMMVMTKFVHLVQGSTLAVTRYDANQPANSSISGITGETIFVTTEKSVCGCGSGSDPVTIGGNSAPVTISQYGRSLRVIWQELLPGTDIKDQAEVEANSYYKTITLTASVDDIMFTFSDSTVGSTVNIAAKLSKVVYANLPDDDPKKKVTIFLKKAVVVKHYHSSGYYAD